MARQNNRLAALQLPKLAKKPGSYPDGNGLYLMVRRPGDASWTFRYRWNGRRPELGLGPLHSVGLTEAWPRAAEAGKLIRDGKDPLAVRRDAKAAAMVEAAKAMTFAEAVEQFMRTDKIEQLKNLKHRAQWKATLDQA